ncbi:MAG: SRPBCC family protein [Bradyrhizobium sp.]
MTKLATPTRSLVIERAMPHPPQKIWRALTQAALIEQWLMKNDFEPVVGHRFNFRAAPINGWNGVTDCEVLEIIPFQRLSYSWNASGDQAPDGLKTIVTWTPTPRETGTHVRMEQSGFRPQDEAGYRGMGGGWPRILGRLEEVASRS